MRNYFTSTLFRKTLAAISGLFLILFLAGHLAGNLQLILLRGEIAQKQFNQYALFMTTNPIVNILSLLTYGSIILHTLLTLSLSIQTRAARPVKYEKSSGLKNTTFSANNMAFLGTIILLFIVVHLRSFWYQMHFGEINMDPWGNKDLYTVTVVAFKEIWYTMFYVISMFFLGFHLKHGVESVFQTVGIKTRKYLIPIHYFSTTIAIVLPLLFASIPIIIYIQSL